MAVGWPARWLGRGPGCRARRLPRCRLRGWRWCLRRRRTPDADASLLSPLLGRLERVAISDVRRILHGHRESLSNKFQVDECPGRPVPEPNVAQQPPILVLVRHIAL